MTFMERWKQRARHLKREVYALYLACKDPRVPWYARTVQKIRLVRYDVDKGVPVRGSDGLCSETANGEVGEAIGKIDPNDPRSRFDGYTSTQETEKKILRDAFAKGDAWFRTGDLMRRDEHGYFYFVDRIGDTFRWKGENVSTGEVGEALLAAPGIREANVYGVAIPGVDGRAGMASLVVDGDFDLDGLPKRLAALPPYARPIFLRLTPRIEVTGTFKQRKVDLVREGFDPSSISDPLYMLDNDTGNYERLTPQRFSEIQSGQARF